MNSRKILIVEDEMIVQLHLRRIVEKIGHEVVGTATTMVEALEAAERNPPELVLMDIHLADGSDGVETARVLTERFDCGVVFATAYADEDPTPNQDKSNLKRQILESLDESDLSAESSSDFSGDPWLSGFRVSKKGPIQFRRTLDIGGDEVLLKIYGPVVKKKPGLRFQLEGLRIGDHPVKMEGFGNVKEGGLRFTVRF